MKNYPAEVWREHKKLHNHLGKKGKLLVWTKVSVAPEGFEHQVPYLVGIVEFEDKERLPLEVVNCEENDLKEDMIVETVVRRVGKADADGVIRYGLKVKPV